MSFSSCLPAGSRATTLRAIAWAAHVACLSSSCWMAGAHAQVVAASADRSTSTTAQLEPVIVTASRSAQTLSGAPIGATVITADDIRRSGVSDANEAIRKLGGVVGRADLSGGREQTLDLRGFGSTADNNIVVLVDGARISENEQASARLSAIPVESIERIEIVRGGSSVLWGDGASAGAINVILKSPQARRGAGLTVGAGSYGERDVRVSGQTMLGALAVDTAVQHRQTRGYRDNNANRQDTGSVGVEFQKDRLKLMARMQAEDQGGGLPGPLTFAEFAADRRQAETPHDDGGITQHRYSIGGEYGWKAWGDWTVQTDLVQRQRDTRYFYAPGNHGQIASDSVQFMPRLTHRAEWSGWAETTTWGFDSTDWTYRTASSYSSEDARQSNDAAYLHTDWSAPTGTRVTAGARKERVTKDAQVASYHSHYDLSASELGLSQSLPGGLDVYGRGALSYRLPNVDDLSFTAVAPAELRAQRNRDVEAGIKWQQGGQRAALRVFRQHTVDEIGYDPTAPGPYGPGANVNLDPTQRRGAELEGSTQVTSAIKLSGTWQTLVARFRSGPQAGREMPLVAPRSGTARASYTINEHHAVDLGLQYRAPMRFGDDNANTCAKRIPSATLLDARYAWTPAQSAWGEWAVSATNLTDRKTYSMAYSCIKGNLYPEVGRALSVTASWRF
ncbi:TonB-dependent receptor [Aquabacterium sp.]|uniref:TonB-dependent receptor n=1 Tax=Aquabacterium sp. TaxID=1872578 RepID=UPI0035AEBBD4